MTGNPARHTARIVDDKADERGGCWCWVFMFRLGLFADRFDFFACSAKKFAGDFALATSGLFRLNLLPGNSMQIKIRA